MQVFHGLEDIPAGFGPSVVTLGNFDGVHRGHRAILDRLVADARSAQARAVALTFDPHPLQVHRPELHIELLTSTTRKLALMADTGLDATLVLHYTMDFARTGPEEFVRNWLVEPLGATRLVVGPDVHFGWRNTGDLTTLQTLGERFGFEVVALEEIGPTGPEGRRWSSSWVREALAAGDVAGAAAVLGRAHRVCGTVVHGDARGRELGYPTANLGPGPSGPVTGMVPADGIYAGWLLRPSRPAAERIAPAAISIGTNPTFDGAERRVEAHVPGRTDLDLYDEVVELAFAQRIRHTLRFSSPVDLVTQMGQDVEGVLAALTAADPAAVGPV